MDTGRVSPKYRRRCAKAGRDINSRMMAASSIVPEALFQDLARVPVHVEAHNEAKCLGSFWLLTCPAQAEPAQAPPPREAWEP